jgi:hypothetical protein
MQNSEFGIEQPGSTKYEVEITNEQPAIAKLEVGSAK